MNAAAPSMGTASFRRIASIDVPAFLAEQDRVSREKKQAETCLKDAEAQAARVRSGLLEEVAAFEARLERRSDELSEMAAAKLKARKEVETFSEGLSQIAGVLRDYQQLDGWMIETVLTAVRSILADLSPDERWAGLIRKTLERTKLRWSLQLLCHPDDHDVLATAIARAGIGGAIEQILCDETLQRGRCFLKSESGLFDLDLQAQVEALESHIRASFSAHGTGG